MKDSPNLRVGSLISALLVAITTLYGAYGWPLQPAQQRPVWEVQLARDAQASSTITIQNQCQQSHTFTVIQQQTPFLQLLASATVNVPGNSTYSLPVRFNTDGLQAGLYQGTVIVKCDTCSQEKTCKQDREVLPVHLTVQDNAQPPQPTPTATLGPPQPTPTPQDRPTPGPTPSGPKPSAGPTPSPSPSPSPCAPAPSPTTYSVKNLGPLSVDDSPASCIATGVNDAGNVIGVCSPSYFGAAGSGAWHAFRTEPGAVIDKAKDDLGLPAGIKSGYSFALGINAAGHVVGYWGPAGDKAFWHDGSKKSKMINLHPVKSVFTTSRAFALNSSDDVVGVAYDPKIKPGIGFTITFGGHAVLWPHADSALMTDLNEYMDPSSKKDWILIAAFDINDAGEIVGRALDLHLGKFHAFLLKAKGAKPIDLGALAEDKTDSSAAYSINACGDTAPAIDKVVGYTFTTKTYHYGFIWTEDGGMLDMGTLSCCSPIYAEESFAQSINKKGEIVGAISPAWHTSPIFDAIGASPEVVECVPNSHAVWYNGKELKDLNKLIPAAPGWELNLANGINDKGLIAGSGFYKCFVLKTGSSGPETFSHLSKAVLLTPAGMASPVTPAPKAPTPSCPIALASSKGYIFDNWNICGVKNGPIKSTVFTLDGDYSISFIATYHWNDGKGALPGAKGISLMDSSGKVFGPWSVITSTGSGGAANVNWECHPGITLPSGTYTIVDPDPATWSQNDASGNSGFARVAGAKK